MATFAVSCLAFVVGPLKRRIALLAFVPLVAAMWLTGARGAMLGLLIACCLILWKSGELNWTTGPIAVGTAVLAIVTNPRFDVAAAVAGDLNPIVYANAFWRIDVWEQLLRGISLQTYITGAGIGKAWESVSSSPHNEYLSYFYDMGLLGLALLVGIVIVTVRHGLTIYHTAPTPLGKTWGLVCVGVVVSDSLFKMVGIPLSAPLSSYTLWMTVGISYLMSQSSVSGATNLRAIQ